MTSTTASALAQKVWNYAHVLRDDGLGFMEYTEQITYLLFIKLVWDQRSEKRNVEIPTRYSWDKLRAIPDNRDLKVRYEQALRNLSKKPGLLGLIFARPQSKIDDPAKLRRLIDLIDEDDWSSLDVDIKGEVYESLLARNSDDVRGGAGQYFTPRPVIRAIIQAIQPRPGMVISDPACGTGGFLLTAYERLKGLVQNPAEELFLRTRALSGADIVPNVARLCAMNLYLHGVGIDPSLPPIKIRDSLVHEPEEQVDVVVTNPPFGKKSSVTLTSRGIHAEKGDLSYLRNDFWVTTSNKQLNFIQHVYSMLKNGGRAAMVVPDNVLFEGGAGEKIRRELITRADVHTMLRLPTGIWYSTAVKANVLFFDKERSQSGLLWVYDLRTDRNFTLRQKPITSDDLKDFVKSYNPDNRKHRIETERFRKFTHSAILANEKASLDLSWLDTHSINDTGELPSHDVLANEVITLLKEAVSDFESAVSVIQKAKDK